MAQHDKPAFLLMERRAMGMEDKPIYRAAAARGAARPPERRDWCGRGRDYTALAHGLAMRARQEDRDTITGACARLDVGGVFLSSRFDSARQAAKALAAAAPRAGTTSNAPAVRTVGVMDSCTDAASD